MGIRFRFDNMDSLKVGDIPGLQGEDKEMLATDRIKEIFNELELEGPEEVEVRICIVSMNGKLQLLCKALEGSASDRKRIDNIGWYV